jgi:ribose transport system permease protein
MMYVLRGFAYYITNGASIQPLPPGMGDLGNISIGGASWAFVALVVAVIIGEVALRKTVWGLEVRATGSDREIAKDTEVDVDKINYSTFIILGLTAVLSGVLLSLRVNGGMATAGLGFEFRAIVACTVGGVSLFGYTGSIVGAFLGTLLTQVISNGLIAVGMPPTLQDVVLGGLLILVIALDIYKRSQQRSLA